MLDEMLDRFNSALSNTLFLGPLMNVYYLRGRITYTVNSLSISNSQGTKECVRKVVDLFEIEMLRDRKSLLFIIVLFF